MISYTKFLAFVTIFPLLAACGGPSASPSPKPADSNVAFYLLSSQPRDAKMIGCEEYLLHFSTPAKAGQPSLEETVKALLAAQPANFGSDVLTATAFTDGYILLDSVSEPAAPSASDPLRVNLKTAPDKGLSGACDTPRITEQLTETVRFYAEAHGNAPFEILLNGSSKEWRCLGDESGKCQ